MKEKLEIQLEEAIALVKVREGTNGFVVKNESGGRNSLGAKSLNVVSKWVYTGEVKKKMIPIF